MADYLELYEHVLNMSDVVYEKPSMKKEFKNRIRVQSKKMIAAARKYFKEYESNTPNKDNMKDAMNDFRESLSNLEEIKSELQSINPKEFNKDSMGGIMAISALFGALSAIVISHWSTKSVAKSLEKSNIDFQVSTVNLRESLSRNNRFDQRKKLDKYVDASTNVKKAYNRQGLRKVAINTAGTAAMAATAGLGAQQIHSAQHAKMLKDLYKLLINAYKISEEMHSVYLELKQEENLK